MPAQKTSCNNLRSQRRYKVVGYLSILNTKR